jgi:hypothetical protein
MQEYFIRPIALSDEVENNPKLNAEREIYYLLKKQIEENSNPFNCSLFYNSVWQEDKKQQVYNDGECDFIIANKDGVLFIEVKGGIVSYDEKNHQWHSSNSKGKFKIQDPIEQVKRSEKFYRNKLIEKFYEKHNERRWIRVKRAVILPYVRREKFSLGAIASDKIFLFSEDKDYLLGKCMKILLHEPDKGSGNYDEFGQEGVRFLKNLIGQSYEFKPAVLALKLREDEREIEKKLTENQIQVLGLMKYQKKLLITGGAGTGKTYLALKKAIELSNEGKKVLLLCYNRPLNEFMKFECKKYNNIECFTFHGFMLTKFNINLLEEDTALDENIIFEKISQDHIFYDCLIIDEGQDFEDQWLLILDLLQENEGMTYIFADDNQKIKNISNDSLNNLKQSPYPLNHNLRNTKSIFNSLSPFYNGDTEYCNNPKGHSIIIDKSSGNLFKEIEKKINTLIIIEKIKSKDITVLTSSSIENSIFSDKEVIAGYQIKRIEDRDDASIVIDSIFRFKGLESNVVIFVCDNNSINIDEVMYVALSRAKLLLHIIVETHEAKILMQNLINKSSN